MSNKDTVTEPLPDNWMEEELNRFYNGAIDHCLTLIRTSIVYPVEGVDGKFVNRDNLIDKISKLKK